MTEHKMFVPPQIAQANALMRASALTLKPKREIWM